MDGQTAHRHNYSVKAICVNVFDARYLCAGTCRQCIQLLYLIHATCKVYKKHIHVSAWWFFFIRLRFHSHFQLLHTHIKWQLSWLGLLCVVCCCTVYGVVCAGTYMYIRASVHLSGCTLYILLPLSSANCRFSGSIHAVMPCSQTNCNIWFLLAEHFDELLYC